LIGVWVAVALAADPVSVRGPITEIEHPRYVDAGETPLMWAEVKDLSSSTDALRQVRRRRLGRTLVRTMFLSATALEVWGTWQLSRYPDRRLGTYLLAGQTAFTGACAVVSFTSAPHDRLEDRAIILQGANQMVQRR
jgi:hypothetical protein